MDSQTAHVPTRVVEATLFVFLVSIVALMPIAESLASPRAEPPRDVRAGILQGMYYLELKRPRLEARAEVLLVPSCADDDLDAERGAAAGTQCE